MRFRQTTSVVIVVEGICTELSRMVGRFVRVTSKIYRRGEVGCDDGRDIGSAVGVSVAQVVVSMI